MSTIETTRWPTMSDYQETVQSPSLCFSDPELKVGSPVTNKLGLPRPICGQFASVYEIDTGNRRCAVKCFLRNIPDQHGRYAKIAEHISRQKTPYFVTFEYQNDGIRVHGELRPLVKMAWVEGLALNQFIEKNLSNPRALLDLESRWLDLLEHLTGVQIAHGDLQHGNVLVVEDGSLRLIDYDGMWVPALEGQTSHETGHPDFQSPLRTGKDFHDEIDFFSGAVVQIAIRALSKDPKLWERYNNGDNLLFRRQDYVDPSQSTLVSELKALGDEVVDERLRVVMKACASLPKRGELVKPAGKRRKRRKNKNSKNNKATKSQKTSQRGGATRGTVPSTPEESQSPRNSPDQKHADGNACPTAQTSPTSWLGDHVAGYTAPAQGSGPQDGTSQSEAPSGTSRRRPSLFRFALHVCVLAPVMVPSVAEWMGLLSIHAGSMTFGQQVVFGAMSCLGALSLGTLLVFCKGHRGASGRFFGFMALLGIYDIAFKLSTNGLPRSTEGSLDPYHSGACLVLLSLIGWLIRPRRE